MFLHSQLQRISLAYQLERDAQGWFLRQKRILRAFNHTFKSVLRWAQRIAAAVFIRSFFDARGELRKAALGAFQVWSGHGRQHFSIELLWRKRDGQPNDCAIDAMLAENFPEGFAFAQQLHRRAGGW